MKRRIYTDTSVIGGCLDVEFEDASRQLMDMFKLGEATLVLSDLTLLELQNAPADVRAVLEEVPAEHREYVELTEEAVTLANVTLMSGSLSRQNGSMHSILRSL